VTALRLLLIDDHPIVLAGLRLLFDDAARYAIIGEAPDAKTARLLAEELLPDMIVTDLVLGGNDRIALVEDLVAIVPDAAILVYSSSDETEWARRVLRAGARGYVSKAEPLEAVATAIDAIIAGKIHISPLVHSLLATDHVPDRRDTPDIAALSSRELQILMLMGDGRSPQALGQELGLSVKTIGSYRERLKIKLGLDNMRMLDRFAAVYVARTAGRR
jgi:two-component system response regulator NreC